MKSNKKKIRSQQQAENRRFNRRLILSFSLLSAAVILILIFVTYWCDTRYGYRMYSLYGKEVPDKLTCLAENVLKVHDTSAKKTPTGTFYLCIKHSNSWVYSQLAKATDTEDAYTHEPISKISAIVGLKKRGEPQLAYFKNGQNFLKYYESREKEN